jgi:hypothetical protein
MEITNDPSGGAGSARGRTAVSGTRADRRAGAGVGRQLEIMHAWLDETCGAEGWATAPAGTTGVVNDALALYFEDAAFAHAFVSRFCCGYRVETIAGAFALRSDVRSERRGTPAHKTP